MLFVPPFPPHDPSDKAGLSYETVARRWPVIVTGVVDFLSRENHDLYQSLQSLPTDVMRETTAAKVEEGKIIVEAVSKLKYEMGRDRPLEPLPQDGEAHVETYNTELERLAQLGQNTWFTAPWLYAECYLYRLIRSYFIQTKHWKSCDPFLPQKMDVFKKSGPSIYQIAAIMQALDKEKEALDEGKFKVLFMDMIQMCLWGNATDLSLLTHISVADIERLQSASKDRQAFILRDDQEQVWKHIQSLKQDRIDFVLDNAGFELFTDLVFADFLVTHTPYVSKVVFHPKLIPWFVSDVTPPDFATTLQVLFDPVTFFGESPSEEQIVNVKQLAKRWQSHVESGVFELSVPIETALGDTVAKASFWTMPWPYWDLQVRDSELWASLRESSLVIFKGDLNYRKLTGDIKWPAWTDFGSALGPLAGSFPVLSLRTNKADVIVGIKREVAEKLDASGERWRVDGRYGLISYLPRSE
ncbi:DUF89 domain-containing protein [Mycena floridula]|nr:DUF89 domain-containing protein [Mycena floridula]